MNEKRQEEKKEKERRKTVHEIMRKRKEKVGKK